MLFPQLITDPVLGHPVRAGLLPVHSDPAGPLLGDGAGVGSLPAHFEQAGPFGALERSGRVLVANPVLAHFA